MFDTSAEGIKEILAAGESEQVEFKSQMPPDEVIADVLTAFANTSGGLLLVGVHEKKGVIGIPDDKRTEYMDRLVRIAQALGPMLGDFGLSAVDDRIVLYADVKPLGANVPPLRTFKGEYLKRVGTSIQKTSPQELIKEILGKSKAKAGSAGKRLTLFVAMSFHEEEDPALVDYFASVKRAVRRTGLNIKIVRIDLVEGDYEISQKILDEIEKADMVLADFTLRPSNVYFELGVARGMEKRIIQTAKKGTSLEFDVRNWRTLFYRNATEYEEALIPAIAQAYADVIGAR
ncbi:MAG: ATP-binding protein [Spirochaetia bacterium]|jgi:hypothetical protein